MRGLLVCPATTSGAEGSREQPHLPPVWNTSTFLLLSPWTCKHLSSANRVVMVVSMLQRRKLWCREWKRPDWESRSVQSQGWGCLSDKSSACAPHPHCASPGQACPAALSLPSRKDPGFSDLTWLQRRCEMPRFRGLSWESRPEPSIPPPRPGSAHSPGALSCRMQSWRPGESSVHRTAG